MKKQNTILRFTLKSAEKAKPDRTICPVFIFNHKTFFITNKAKNPYSFSGLPRTYALAMTNVGNAVLSVPQNNQFTVGRGLAPAANRYPGGQPSLCKGKIKNTVGNAVLSVPQNKATRRATFSEGKVSAEQTDEVFLQKPVIKKESPSLF
ncbi:MAG: hypothetical protein IJA06_05205 [Oscillospiraceae bacterium]|nr:hypothetical protein [Oscillospiraceae bacterium]